MLQNRNVLHTENFVEAAQYTETTYTVTTYTYNIVDADTDDDVYISLIGSKGNTTEYEADNDGDDRERGQTDVYKFSDDADIGEFQCVLMRKSGSDGWLIEKVYVYRLNLKRTS